MYSSKKEGGKKLITKSVDSTKLASKYMYSSKGSRSGSGTHEGPGNDVPGNELFLAMYLIVTSKLKWRVSRMS